MPIEASNPYGGYYDFGSMQSAMAQGVPTGPMGMDEHMGRYLGQGGGFRPSQTEDMMRRGMDRLHQQSMSDALKSDARANTMTNFVLDQLYGADSKRRAAAVGAAGGQAGMREWVSALINMPGASGFLGGDIRSVRLGASAIAGSGGLVSTTAGQSQMFGSGLVQNAAAQSIFQSVNQRFWNPSGAANMALTNGMNRDQVGGIMMMGAQGGAFSGMDLGKITRSGEQLKFAANPGSMQKIEDFVKESTKALSSLVDVFGDRSVGELASLAQRITGLDMSSMRNVQTMGNRIAGLKATAQVFGVDNRTMFDTAAQLTGFGQSMGMAAHTAGTIGTMAAQQGVMSHSRLKGDPGFFRVAPSAQEIGAGIVRDQAAMMRDPIGARIQASELLIETGMIKESDQARIRKASAGLTADNISSFDALVRQTSGGISPSQIIRQFGDGAKIGSQLSAEGQERASRSIDANMRGRQMLRITDMARTLTGSSEVAGLSTSLVEKFSTGDIQSMAKAVDAGRVDEAMKIAMKDTSVVKSEDEARTLVGKFSRIKELRGGESRSTFDMLDRSMRADSLTQRFTSQADEMKNLRDQDQVSRLSSDQTRQLTSIMGKGVQGFLEFAGKDTQLHKLGMMAVLRPGSVGGMKVGQEVFLDPGHFDKNAAGMLTEKGAGQFASTLGNIMQQDPDMALRMGINWREFHKDQTGFAKQNFGRIMGLMSDPLEKQRIFQGRISAMGPEGQLFWGLQKNVVDSRVGQTAATLSLMGSAAETNPAASDMDRKFFEVARLQMAQGKLTDPASLGKIHDFVAKRTDLLDREGLIKLAKVDQEGAQRALGKIQDELTGLETAENQTTKSDPKRVARIKELESRKQALENEGIGGTSGAGKFMGVLQLVGNDGLQIKVTKK